MYLDLNRPSNLYPDSPFGFGGVVQPGGGRGQGLSVTPLPQSYGTVTPTAPTQTSAPPAQGGGYEDPNAEMSMAGSPPPTVESPFAKFAPTESQLKTGYEDPNAQQSIMGSDQATELRKAVAKDDKKPEYSSADSWGAFANALKPSESKEGSSIGGNVGSGLGAAAGAYFGAGNPMAIAAGSAIGKAAGSIVDFFIDSSDAAEREREALLKKKQAEKFQRWQEAKMKKTEMREDYAYQQGLESAAHAKELQRKAEQAKMAQTVFNILQARQTRRGLGGYGVNELSRMGGLSPLRERKF